MWPAFSGVLGHCFRRDRSVTKSLPSFSPLSVNPASQHLGTNDASLARRHAWYLALPSYNYVHMRLPLILTAIWNPSTAAASARPWRRTASSSSAMNAEPFPPRKRGTNPDYGIQRGHLHATAAR